MKRILSLICVLAMVLGMITVPAFATEAETLQEKVDSYTSGTITLTENAEKLVVNANTYIDLNGYSIDGIAVAEGATVYVSDSQTDDYTVADGVYGAITGITGAVEAAQGYVAVEENNTVSFHRVDLAIKSMSLRPGVAGVYYTSSFAADEVVSAKVESYGVALSVVEAPDAENLEQHCGYSVLYDFGAGEKSGTLLTGIMDAENDAETNAAHAAMDVYGRAYIKTAEGYTFGAVAVRNLQQQVEAIDAILGNLSATQKAGITAFYNTYKAAMESWNIPNLRSEQVGDIVITVPVESENGVVTETVTVEADGMSITVPFGTLLAAGATELTLNVTKKAQSDSGIEAAAGETLMPFEVHVEGVSSENTVPLTVALGKVMPENLNMGNYSIYHVEASGTKEMTLVAADEAFTAHNQYKYTLDGELTLHMATFSEVAALTNDTNVWNGGIATSFGGGTGAEADPYLIRNADQLAYLNVLVSADDQDYVEASYKLLSDIDFGGAENVQKKGNIWYPIGYWHRGEGTNSAGEDTWYTYGGAFMGTFDGNGHKIANIHQNTWSLNGNYGQGYWDEAMGLFGYVYNGTVKNLTMEGFYSEGEFTPTGCVAAYAANSTFENIALVDCNPCVYNTGNGGIVGIGGNPDDPDTFALTFNNITIDNTNKITALWGSWDVACGGLVGMFRGAGQVYMNNCHVAAQIDVYNDVCGNYQYYWYRYSGMLIGTNKNMITDKDGYTVPETSKFHATNCTVHFGDWNNYYYCELVANSLASYTHDHQFSRLTEIKSLNEIKTGDTWTKTGNFVLFTDSTRDVETATCFHIVKAEDGSFVQHNHDDAGEETVNGEPVLMEDKQIVYLPFNQLFTGYGWGVKHIPIYDDGTPNPFGGVTILDRLPSSEVKFEDVLDKTLAQSEDNLIIAENTVLTVGQLFEANEGALDIQTDKVQVFVSPADEDSTVEPVTLSCSDNWSADTLQFKGRGKATVTITDYYFCTPTTITVTVGSVNDAAKAMVLTGTDTVDAFCPACATTATWEPLPEKAFTLKGQTTEDIHKHYFAVEGGNYNNTSHYMVSTTSSSKKATMCLNLNNQTLTSTVRALIVDLSKSTMNVMGEGTVIGGGLAPDTVTNTVPSRGAVDSTGTLNLYGGTYKCTSNVQPVLSLRGTASTAITNMYEDVVIDRTGTKGLGVFLCENNKMNMYGGTIIGGDSTDITFKRKDDTKTRYVYGGNVCVYAIGDTTANTTAFNMYGGTITGGKDTNGGNIYVTGSAQTAKSVLNIQGGMITDGNNGNIYVTGANSSVQISGNPVIDGINLNTDKVVTVGEMTEGASVTFNEAKGTVVSAPIDGEIPATYGQYFHAQEDGLDVTVVDNVLKVTDAVCPHCGYAYAEIEWTELRNKNAQIIISGSNHYRVMNTLVSSSNTLKTAEDTEHDVVVDLNGQTITTKGGNRGIILYGSGSFTLVDTVGGGVVTTTSTNTALGGAALYATDTIVANIYGGTFLASGMKADGTIGTAGTTGNGSCISAYGSGSRINIYNATVRGFANKKSGSVYGGVLYNRGKMYIYDIDLDVYVNDTENISYGIYQYDAGTLRIEGGTFDSIGGNENHILIGADNTTYLYGGTINGTVETYEASIMNVGYDVHIDELKLASGHTANLYELSGASIGITAEPGVAFTKNLSSPNSYLDDFHAKNPEQYIAIKTDTSGNRTLTISDTKPCECCDAVTETIEVSEMTAELAKQMGTLGGHYKLMADVTVTSDMISMSQIALTKNMMLDLNGHTWTSAGGRCFYISDAARLTIMDSGEMVDGQYTGALIGNYDAGGGVINATANAQVDMYGGNLYSYGEPHIGGAVYLSSATFNLHDGVIHGCNVIWDGYNGDTTPKAGAVYVTKASGYSAVGKFNMYGGLVTGGYAAGRGDCIYVYNGYANIYGGTIDIDEAAGATNGIYAGDSGYINLYGGNIGGSVHANKSSRITISDNPIVELLDVTNDVTVKLGALTEGARIAVKADAGFAFTAANEKAADYLQYFAIHESLAETLEIAVVNNQLVAQTKTSETTE